MAPVLPATFANLPATRGAILLALKRAGSARAPELAAQVGVTASAMRQHLGALARDGLVSHLEVRTGPGRPKHVYHLTEEAEAYFPRAYGELTNELLGYVEDTDPGLVDALFARRQRRRIKDARARMAGLPMGEKVAVLARILDEDGYLATSEQVGDGVWHIIEHNCAIATVARHYGQACSSELKFIQAVLPGAQVQRVAHMVAGARMCAYEVRATVAQRPSARHRAPRRRLA